MDISPFEQWKLRYIIHLAIYLNLNSPTDFFDEALNKLRLNISSGRIENPVTQAIFRDMVKAGTSC
jgi:hypothetical protein